MSHSAADTHGHDDPTHGIGHVMPMKILIGVFLALVVLTFATVAVTWVDLGNLNLYVALGIAVIKASLVVLFFMHLLYDRPFNAVVFIGCLIFVTLFISMAMTDSNAYHSSVIPGQAFANMRKEAITAVSSLLPVESPEK